MMKKTLLLLAATGVLFAQSLFAMPRDQDFKPCYTIATACKQAGYSVAQPDKMNHDNKAFWFHCMRPLLLGNTVKGVTVDPNTVKACRENKIKMLKKELSDMENVK